MQDNLQDCLIFLAKIFSAMPVFAFIPSMSPILLVLAASNCQHCQHSMDYWYYAEYAHCYYHAY